MRAHRILAVFALSVLLASCSGGGGSSKPNAAGYAPGSQAPPTPGGSRVTADNGASLEVAYAVDAPTSVTARVNAPAGATQMQLSVDASFGDASWQPVVAQTSVLVEDTGYVQVFARFRAGANATPTKPLVAGVVVDPSWAAVAVASRDRPHEAVSVGLAAPDVLAVRVETGRVMRGGQEPYNFASPTPGDEITSGDGGVKVVHRDGKLYGTQVSAGVDLLMRPDVIAGYPLSTDVLDKASKYSVTSTDDSAFDGGQKPTAVRRVTRPVGQAQSGSSTVAAVTHDLYLHLKSAPKEGSTYTVTFPDGAVAPATFTFDPKSSRSAAVHANQVGYRPDDALKVAYVSAWEGSGIDLPSPLQFTVVDAANGSVVLEGQSHERTTPPDGEVGHGDLTGAPVQELDFSQLRSVGRYRVCVTSLGCSYDFDVSETSTWRRVAVSVARAMYHQRSGTALTEPYTSVNRPRGFHPDDGIQVRQSGVTELQMDAAQADGGGFSALVDAATNDIVPNAWGGHFDAGDWDRRIAHLSYLRAALDLVELYPSTWATLNLDIPESSDAIPDVIDEGLWDLDFYRRMQTSDGGIRGGIESDEHPLPRQTSWTQTQQVFAFAPDAGSSYVYAGVAAETARVLAAYDQQRANVYRQSALAAMTWAERNPVQGVQGDQADQIKEERATAAAALFRLTGDTRWQDIFLQTTDFANGPLDLMGCELLRVCDAAWIYARTDQPGIRQDVKRNVIETFRRSAEILANTQDTTRFGWSLVHPAVPLVWGLGPSVPKTIGLLRAYTLTGTARYCSATIRSASFSLGANPLDTVFVTGIGARNVRNPLIVDNIFGAVPIWPGTPIYGLHTLNKVADESWVAQYQLNPAGATPNPESVPFLQSWYDMSSVPMYNEFTVHQSHAVALYAYGSLAGLHC